MKQIWEAPLLSTTGGNTGIVVAYATVSWKRATTRLWAPSDDLAHPGKHQDLRHAP